MDILRNKPQSEKESQFEDFLLKKDRNPETEQPREEDFLKAYPGKILTRWRSLEFEPREHDRKWLAYAALVIIAIVGYAVYTNSPVVSILFILIGAIGYIYLNKKPRVLDFAITDTGVIADKEIYQFENIHSFWIFYAPPQEKVLSLHTKSYLMPFVHIPIGDESPVKIREMLLKYIPEIKQNPSFADMLERLLGI
ncbi:MAG: hypothetical protein AAB487_03000 [Patescibacteria group bacterium]